MSRPNKITPMDLPLSDVESPNRVGRGWRITFLGCGVAAIVAVSGYCKDQLICVACGEYEVNRYYFGKQFEHTVIRPGTFLPKRRAYREPFCRVGQHQWSGIRSYVFGGSGWET